MNDRRSTLQVRLLNCLQTIIEMEEKLSAVEGGVNLASEFQVLQSVMDRIDELEILEEDVQRVEAATGNFLKELAGPLSVLIGKTKRPYFIQ